MPRRFWTLVAIVTGISVTLGISFLVLSSSTAEDLRMERLTSADRAKLCPSQNGYCAGFRFGDLDGDGKTDAVGLTFDNGHGARPQDDPDDAQGYVTAHILLAKRDSYSQKIGTARLIQTGWIGITDVNADHHAEIFVSSGGGEHLQFIYIYEYAKDRAIDDHPDRVLVPLRGITDGRFSIDNADSTKAGIACGVTASGRPQITQWRVDWDTSGGRTPIYKGTERTWEANARGIFAPTIEGKLKFTDNSPGASEFEQHTGVACQNLARFTP